MGKIGQGVTANGIIPKYQSGAAAPGVETSEDCLYLNVWSPAKSARDRMRVLVWIYGGGFSVGATSEPSYSGENLARKGVVLVSIAYRVGQMGFFVHPELSVENHGRGSGNSGLLHLIAGLEWVQRNIAAFGGDPHRVTIFGESAGGIAVSMLCASPLAKGLFQGAISESGGSFGPPRPTTFPGESLKRLAMRSAPAKRMPGPRGPDPSWSCARFPPPSFRREGAAKAWRGPSLTGG